jgi:hypothetical protein
MQNYLRKEAYITFSPILDESHQDPILKGVKDWVYLFKEDPVL